MVIHVSNGQNETTTAPPAPETALTSTPAPEETTTDSPFDNPAFIPGDIFTSTGVRKNKAPPPTGKDLLEFRDAMERSVQDLWGIGLFLVASIALFFVFLGLIFVAVAEAGQNKAKVDKDPVRAFAKYMQKTGRIPDLTQDETKKVSLDAENEIDPEN